jgi:hypothetical protein
VMESLTTPAQPLPVMPPLTNTPRGLGCFQVLTVIVPPRVERQHPLTTVHVEQVEQQDPRDPDHARAPPANENNQLAKRVDVARPFSVGGCVETG